MNNLPRQKLSELVKIYGKDVCRDQKRFRGLLNDFCSGNYPEINFLLTALEEQVYTTLQTSSKTMSYDLLSARLVQRLYTNRGMAEEVAHWAVDSWALALGVIPNETPYTKPQAPVSNMPSFGITSTTRNNANITNQQAIVVSPAGGHYTSISEALRNAHPGSLILVKPGYYYEGLVVDKRIEIKGYGPEEQVIVETRDTSCIQMRTHDEALVQGLTLRCRSPHTKQTHAVDISMGRLKLVDCDITCDSLACVNVHGASARPEIRGCKLHDAINGSGLLIGHSAKGTIENCQIYDNNFPNISIRYNANPIVKNCQIYGGGSHGILVWKNGLGTIEDCDIYENAGDGVKVKEGGQPIVRGCRIYRNKNQEEWVFQSGMGNRNFPFNIASSGIRLQRGNPEIRSEAISTRGIYPVQNVAGEWEIAYQQEIARQQEMLQQAEKRPSLIHSFLRSIGLRKE